MTLSIRGTDMKEEKNILLRVFAPDTFIRVDDADLNAVNMDRFSQYEIQRHTGIKMWVPFGTSTSPM